MNLNIKLENEIFESEDIAILIDKTDIALQFFKNLNDDNMIEKISEYNKFFKDAKTALDKNRHTESEHHSFSIVVYSKQRRFLKSIDSYNIEYKPSKPNLAVILENNKLSESIGKIARDPKANKDEYVFHMGMLYKREANIKKSYSYTNKDIQGTITYNIQEEMDEGEAKLFYNIVAMGNQSKHSEKLQRQNDEVVVVTTTLDHILERINILKTTKNRENLMTRIKRLHGCSFKITGYKGLEKFEKGDHFLAYEVVGDKIQFTINSLHSSVILNYIDNPYNKIMLSRTKELSDYTFSIYVWISNNVILNKGMFHEKKIKGLIDDITQVQQYSQDWTKSKINNFYKKNTANIIKAFDELEEKNFIEINYKNRGVQKKETIFHITKRFK